MAKEVYLKTKTAQLKKQSRTWVGVSLHLLHVLLLARFISTYFFYFTTEIFVFAGSPHAQEILENGARFCKKCPKCKFDFYQQVVMKDHMVVSSVILKCMPLAVTIVLHKYCITLLFRA